MGEQRFLVEQCYDWFDGLVNIVPDILTGKVQSEPEVKVTDTRTGRVRRFRTMAQAAEFIRNRSH